MADYHVLFRKEPLELKGQLQNINDMAELERVVLGRSKKLVGLRAAINEFEKKENLSFFETLYPSIVSYLSEKENISQLKLLYCGNNDSISLTHKQIRFIIANAFFLNIKNETKDGFGFFDFAMIMLYNNPIGIERIKCLLAYFTREMKCNQNEIYPEISIERYCEEFDNFPSWNNCDLTINPDNFIVHTDNMEKFIEKRDLNELSIEKSNITLVDFANKQIHIGVIASSMTQEEVLFSCAPECFLCLIVCEMLLPTEVVYIRNVRTTCDYIGFNYTFKQQNVLYDSSSIDILVLDASCYESFSPKMVIRDLNKAFVGFKNAKTDSISTGHWGCGAFGGDKTFKFLQQICVAQYLGKKLYYSTFEDEDCKNHFINILQLLKEKQKTITEIALCLFRYNDSKKQYSNFQSYFSAWINE